LGYIVASYWIGARLGALANLRVSPYLLLIIGLIALQVIGWIPWLGGLLVFIAMVMGTGALVRYFWQSRQAPEPVTTGSGVTV